MGTADVLGPEGGVRSSRRPTSRRRAATHFMLEAAGVAAPGRHGSKRSPGAAHKGGAAASAAKQPEARRAWVLKHLVALLVPVLQRAGRGDVVDKAKAAARDGDGRFRKSAYVASVLRSVFGDRLAPGGDWHAANLRHAEGDARFEAFVRAAVKEISSGRCAYRGPAADLWYRPPPSRADGVPNQEFTLNFALWDTLPGLDVASLRARLAGPGLPLAMPTPAEALAAADAGPDHAPAPLVPLTPTPAEEHEVPPPSLSHRPSLERLMSLDEMRPFLAQMYDDEVELTHAVDEKELSDTDDAACCSSKLAREPLAERLLEVEKAAPAARPVDELSARLSSLESDLAKAGPLTRVSSLTPSEGLGWIAATQSSLDCATACLDGIDSVIEELFANDQSTCEGPLIDAPHTPALELVGECS